MPPSAADTRRKLIDAATRAFADDGIWTASLLDITRRAGQKNRNALHYHFGSREGVLCAVLEQHTAFLAKREGELLDIALTRPDQDVGSVVEAIVRPAAELAARNWRGRCFLVVLAQLVDEDQDALHPDVRAAMAHTGGYVVYDLLARRMTPVSDEVRLERFALITSFILRTVANRARASGRRRKGRQQLDDETFVANLVAVVAAMATAPPPTAVDVITPP